MVEKDEFDKGPRALFNYGHTFGHAIEVISDFKVSHGQAVTRGMDIANFISLKENKITYSIFKENRSILEKNFPGIKININQIDRFIGLLKKDKKAHSGEIRCIIPEKENNMIIHSITDFAFLEKIISQYVQEIW
jgi:3-dehydroquinate synthase